MKNVKNDMNFSKKYFIRTPRNNSSQIYGFLYQSGLFFDQKIQKFHFCLKSLKMIFSKFCRYKMFILSCFTIFQPHSTYKTSIKKPLGFTLDTHNGSFFTVFRNPKIWDELLRGVLINIFFSKN